jgi:HAD superfamily hydrolase (TIGR01509 family)
VFDCDGLLIDSANCWRSAYAALAEENGATLEDLDLTALAGASVAGAAAQIRNALGIPVEEARLRQLLGESFVASPPPPMPGAQALVQGFAARCPVGVASNAPSELLQTTLERLELNDLVRVVISAELTPAEKPAPDVYAEACRQLGVCPSDAVAFEDSPLGARSARAAGLFLVAVPSETGLMIDADLTVSRLDNPRLLRFFRFPMRPADQGLRLGDVQ